MKNAKAVMIFSVCLVLGSLQSWAAPELCLADGDRVAPIWVAPGESPAVHLAIRDLMRDITEVTGHAPALIVTGAPPAGAIWMATATNPDAQAALSAGGVAPATLAGKWENYVIKPGAGLLVAGSDERGTVFGVYDVATRYFGVDPIANWTGLPAAKRTRVVVADGGVTVATPAFHFRGWFLNDEDLITDAEYVELVEVGADSARRLEGYDALRAEVAALLAALLAAAPKDPR